MRILLIDNYDSFTYNLYDYFMQLGTVVTVLRNDDNVLAHLAKQAYDALVLSPGPATPYKAAELMNVIADYYEKLPMLGICLGHQAIGQFFGAELHKAEYPMHGKISKINHNKKGIFRNLENPMVVMRYHSLVLEVLPQCIEPIAFSSSQEVMAIKHKKYPLWGVQFHPESILTTEGKKLLENWVEMLRSI